MAGVKADVAIISVAMTDLVSGDPRVTVPEMVFEVARRAVLGSGLARNEIDLTMSGSSDMLEGRAFNFAFALEAMGAHPATDESHVEMDGAWALFYAWLKILSGEARSALVVAFSKSSEGSLHHVTNTQLDPFFLAPLGLDRTASAALQADAWMSSGNRTLSDLDGVVNRARANAARNELVRTDRPAEDAPIASPLWRRHCPPVTDGACAIVIAEESVARRVCDRPVWIRGADHRIESSALAERDLGRSRSTELALARARAIAGWDETTRIDVAEISASHAHEEMLLKDALTLADDVALNPSGGALSADPLMVTGLIRIAECALQLSARAGAHQVAFARRALAHASQGHALQHNMVWLLEAEGG
jgi:acetyl-CoA acetyltransferase